MGAPRSSGRPPLPAPEPVPVRNTGLGLGVQINPQNVVMSLVPGGQAELDGVRLSPGDKVVGVDGVLLGARPLASVLRPAASHILLVRRIEAVRAVRGASNQTQTPAPHRGEAPPQVSAVTAPRPQRAVGAPERSRPASESEGAASSATAAFAASPPRGPFDLAHRSLDAAFLATASGTLRRATPSEWTAVPAWDSLSPSEPWIARFEVPLHFESAWPAPNEGNVLPKPMPGVHRKVRVPPKQRDPARWRAQAASLPAERPMSRSQIAATVVDSALANVEEAR